MLNRNGREMKGRRRRVKAGKGERKEDSPADA